MHGIISGRSLNPQPSHAVLPYLVKNRRTVITIIGGGGKTSLMYLWAHCLQAAGYSVVTTTTTKLSAANWPGVEFTALSSLIDARSLLSGETNPTLIRTLHTGYLPATDKLEGLPATWIDSLSQEFPKIIFLVEGDGSAGRSLKGHHPHEPVIPESTTLLVPVIGLDVLGKPVSAAHVHRPEVFCHIIGTRLDLPITPADVHNVIFNQAGYLSHAPQGVSIMPFFNKAESGSMWKLGYELAKDVLAANYAGLDRVLIGSIHDNQFSVLS